MSLSPCSLPRDISKITKYFLYNIFLFLIIDSIYVLPVSMFYMYLYCVVLYTDIRNSILIKAIVEFSCVKYVENNITSYDLSISNWLDLLQLVWIGLA